MDRPEAGAGLETGQSAAEFWQELYAERDQIWSGRPNDALVAIVAALRPGRALDLGCGEGADSIWLASQGWQVTAVDIAATAIGRAKERAAARSIPEGQITWVVGDLSSWQPDSQYELVSAFFLHSRVGFPRAAVLQRAAGAVAPGGHLLVVGHTEYPPWSEGHHHEDHHFLSPAEEVANLELDEGSWDILASELRPRQATGPDGQRATLDDTVVFLRRRAS